MFKLCFNRNDILKQLDEITMPVMILKPYMRNNDRCDTFVDSS